MHHQTLCSHADINPTGGRQGLPGTALSQSLMAADRRAPLGRSQTTAQAQPICSMRHRTRIFRGLSTTRLTSNECLAGKH